MKEQNIEKEPRERMHHAQRRTWLRERLIAEHLENLRKREREKEYESKNTKVVP